MIEEWRRESVKEGKNNDLKWEINPSFILTYPDIGNSFNHKLNIKTNIREVRNVGRIRKTEDNTLITFPSFCRLLLSVKNTINEEKIVENSIE